MSNMAICRVCLASNTKMHNIANTPYREIMEKLAMELCTADGRPETVCWLCLSALRRARRLADTARAAHEVLTQLSVSGIQVTEDTVSMLDKKFLCKLAWTSIETISISKEFIQGPSKVEIKEEPCGNEEYTDLLKEDEQISCNLSESEPFTVKNEEIFFDNSEGKNEENTGNISENEQSTNEYEQINHNLFKSEPLTVENEEIFCDSISIGENEKYTSNINENELRSSDVSDNQITGNTSVNEPQNIVDKIALKGRKRIQTNRSKLKKLSEVIVKDQKGQDCVRHICPTCDKTYKQRCHLLRHLKTHRTTASKSSSHTHSPPKDVICDKCGKGFVNNYTLKKHLLAHRDERKFSCAHCPIKLVQKSDLIRHMRIHTGQKPYHCDVCDKQYSQKAMLVRHMIIHTGEKPYSCDPCNLKFNRHSSMVRHFERKHLCSGKKRYM